MIRLRLLHPGRRVWRLRKRHQDGTLVETWISLRLKAPHWERIFSSTLDLIWLPSTCQAGRIQMTEQHGFIAWREGRWTTKFSVRIDGFSTPKEALIAGALLKAARFNQLEE